MFFSNAACCIVIATGLFDWFGDASHPWLDIFYIGFNAYLIGQNAKTLRRFKQSVADEAVYAPSPFLRETLFNANWFNQNQKAMSSIFPSTWTHFDNLDVRAIVEGLRALGVAIDKADDLIELLSHLERIRFMLRNGQLIKRNTAGFSLTISKS